MYNMNADMSKQLRLKIQYLLSMQSGNFEWDQEWLEVMIDS